jgi:uncharacterized protein (TIGR02246 family)
LLLENVVMAPLERALAEAEIARLITRYAVLNDEGDFDALAALFMDDGIFVRPSGGDPIVGRANILTSYKARPPRRTRHIISNILVEVRSPSEAEARSTMLLYAVAPGETRTTQAPLLGGSRDRVVCVDGTWLFAERRGWLDFQIGA